MTAEQIENGAKATCDTLFGPDTFRYPGAEADARKAFLAALAFIREQAKAEFNDGGLFSGLADELELDAFLSPPQSVE